MTYTKIDYHLKNFVGSINLLGSERAPKLRMYYSAITSFHLSTLYSRSNDDLSIFEYNVRTILGKMKLQGEIYQSTENVFREKHYFVVCLKVNPLFSTPEVLNIYSTLKPQAEWENEWKDIKNIYAELLV